MDYLQQPRPRNLFGTGSSVQGWGLPASIGVQLARPEQRVLAIVGDGGFTFTCQALWTAGRYQVPATILVLNNHGYRSMRGSVLRVCERAVAAEYDFDFEFEVGVVDVARGFGVDAVRVSDPSTLADVVRDAMRDDRPQVIEVVTSSDPTRWI
jgi:benzoylformate decarboxylase